MDAFDPFQPEPRRNALRLTFRYVGTEIRVVSEQRVEMVTPFSDRLDEYEGHSGAWLELRDAHERVIYRRVIRNPIDTYVEAPSGDPNRPFTHVPKDPPEGIFVLVTPDLPEAVSLHLFATVPPNRADAAKEISRVSLRAQRKQE